MEKVHAGKKKVLFVHFYFPKDFTTGYKIPLVTKIHFQHFLFLGQWDSNKKQTNFVHTLTMQVAYENKGKKIIYLNVTPLCFHFILFVFV